MWLRTFAAGLLYFGSAVVWFATLERLAVRLGHTPEQKLFFKGLVGFCFVIASAILVALITGREWRKQLRIEQALRESEARLGALIDSALDAIITIDSGRRVVVFNPAAQQMFGRSATSSTGQPVQQFLPGVLDATQWRQAMDQPSVATGFLSVKGRRGDGAEFPAEASLSHMESHGERFWTFIVRDVTERRRLEEKLRQANATLEKRVAERTSDLQAVNRELESFCYSVAHDLRAPLRSIRGFAKLLEEEAHGNLNSTASGFLDRIGKASGHMGQLIDAWLELARVTRGELRREAVDLSALGEAIVKDLRQVAPERSVQFICANNLTVRGDPSLLRILLENLLGNAWKFTQKTETARIELGGQRRNGASLIFYVKDNGAGFAMKNAANLFQPFQRLHSTSDFEGTGVGLATCQRIVLRHGGCIWAEGAVNEGATIFFSIPELEPGPRVAP